VIDGKSDKKKKKKKGKDKLIFLGLVTILDIYIIFISPDLHVYSEILCLQGVAFSIRGTLI